MNRRAMLAGTGIVLSAFLSGCATEDSPETGDDTDETPTSTEDIVIVLRNRSERTRAGTLSLSTDAETILGEEFEVAAGERQSVDSGITETDQYELTVTLESGPEATFPFSIDEFDLEAGSDLIVELAADDINTLIEE